MSVSHTLDNVKMYNVNVLINKFIAIATFDICSIHSLRPEKFRDAMSTSALKCGALYESFCLLPPLDKTSGRGFNVIKKCKQSFEDVCWNNTNRHLEPVKAMAMTKVIVFKCVV